LGGSILHRVGLRPLICGGLAAGALGVGVVAFGFPHGSALGRLPIAATETSRPACSGVKPATSWKRWVVTSCRPAIANRVNTADSVPA
uniref:hypothetical protein n=1 Tax=Enterobacter hormaechei TaxID=158836 RepID=UPI0020413E18